MVVFRGWRGISLVLVVLLGVCSSPPVSARGGFKVERLPGFSGPLPFHLETGYVGVEESVEVQLFYYFVKSTSNPKLDPVVLWISGGPGCSSLFALTQEFGPLLFDRPRNNRTLPTLSLNPYPWTQAASFIFLDLPVGTGFSYYNTSKSYMPSTDDAGDHAAEFLRKWLVDNSEYHSNSLYIGGDSYSGLTIPVVVNAVLKGIEKGLQPQVPFKGYLIGNGVTLTGPYDNYYMFPFLRTLGFISDEFYETLEKDCYASKLKNNGVYLSKCDLESFKLLKLIDHDYVENSLSTSCDGQEEMDDNEDGPINNITSMANKKFRGLLAHALQPYIRCQGRRIANRWANDDSVQGALHVRKGSLIGEWDQCRPKDTFRYNHTVTDTRPYHAKFSAMGIRSLIYSGDHDLLVPSRSTETWTKALNYSTVDHWRPWFLNGQIAGYTRSFSSNMTYATIKGSGHIAPIYTPLECLLMFKRWVSYQQL